MVTRPGRRSLWWIAALLSLSSCGGLFSSFPQELVPLDSLVAVPGRFVYPLGEPFDTGDLKVLAVYPDGTTREIPVEAVSITGAENFDLAGEKLITVSYGGKTASFTVTVGSGQGEGTGGGGSSGDGINIIIEWS
jgi:hypothetical protein